MAYKRNLMYVVIKYSVYIIIVCVTNWKSLRTNEIKSDLTDSKEVTAP